MDEMDRLPIDSRRELRQPVKRSLLSPPVEACGPIASELLQVVERHAAAPVAVRIGLGPASALEAAHQIVEIGLWNVDGEGSDIGHSGLLFGLDRYAQSLLTAGVSSGP